MLREFPVQMGVMKPPGSGAPDHGDVPVRDVAAVMLVRPADAGVEVFAFRRRPTLVFAAGMLVFPGGSVEPADADPATAWQGPGPAAFAGALSAGPDAARALVAAAVRETFEECGVLLAGPAGGEPAASPLLADPGWEARRSALLAGEATLASLLAEAGWVLRADLLLPWAHWITPPGERRRFDTRFFVAVLPAGQEAVDLGGEGERAAWLRPADALAGHAAGEVPMLPPTYVAMEELAAVTSVADLVERAGARRPRPVSPWLAQQPDGEWVLRIDLDGIGGGDPPATR